MMIISMLINGKRLTLTWDVFKCLCSWGYLLWYVWLTLTWDVFK